MGVLNEKRCRNKKQVGICITMNIVAYDTLTEISSARCETHHYPLGVLNVQRLELV
jgi:hypothetical protein